jgi:hypothetical protein
MSTCASTDAPDERSGGTIDKEYDTFVWGRRDRKTGRVIPPRKIRCPECGKNVRRIGLRFRCGCGAETTMQLPEEKKDAPGV